MTELTLQAPAQKAPVQADDAAPTARSRNAGLDALRATLTLLVIFHHTALTYGAIGGWYYREVPTDGRIETKLLIFFCTLNQAYFMGLFFLLAGYFTPAAVEKNGALAYCRERLLRLGVPLMVYGFIIGPATIALARTRDGWPFLGNLMQLWQRGLYFENGPLWFAQALLIFAGGYLIWRGIASRFDDSKLKDSPPSARPFPSNTAIALTILATGATAFALRLVWPVSQQVFGLQLGYFASYVVLFIVGCAGAPGRWLDKFPEEQRRLWRIVTRIAIPVLPAVVLLAPYIPQLQGDTMGGWNIQAAVYAFWEPFVAWGLILTLLSVYRRTFPTLNSIWAALSRRAYAIYIIHPPVLVAIALAWRQVAAPHMVKFAVTGTLACLACFWIAGLLVRFTPARRII